MKEFKYKIGIKRPELSQWEPMAAALEKIQNILYKDDNGKLCSFDPANFNPLKALHDINNVMEDLCLSPTLEGEEPEENMWKKKYKLNTDQLDQLDNCDLRNLITELMTTLYFNEGRGGLWPIGQNEQKFNIASLLEDNLEEWGLYLEEEDDDPDPDEVVKAAITPAGIAALDKAHLTDQLGKLNAALKACMAAPAGEARTAKLEKLTEFHTKTTIMLIEVLTGN